MSDIGDKVRHFRKERGISQEELAEGICSRQTISLLENGQHTPSTYILQKIAEKIGLSFYELVQSTSTSLDQKVQVDVLKAYVASADYQHALELAIQLERHEDLPEHLKRETILCKAESLTRTGQADQSLSILMKVQEEMERKKDSDDHTLANVHHKIGTAYYYLSDMYNAYTHYTRAFQIAKAFPQENVLAATISYNLGNVCRQIDLDEQAVVYLTKAKDFFEAFANPKQLAHALFGLGISYKNLGDLEQAERYLLQAQSMYEAQQVYSLAQVSKQGYLFGILAKKDPQLALEELIKSLPENEALGDAVHLAYTFARIAHLCVESERLGDADHYIERALTKVDGDRKERSEYPFVMDPRVAYVYQVYSKYLLSAGQIKESIEMSYKSAKMFDKMGLKNDEAESLKLAVDAHEKAGDLEKALHVTKEIVKLLQKPQVVS